MPPRPLPWWAALPVRWRLGAGTRLFVPAGQSPTERPLVVVANEITGTVSIYAQSSKG